MGSRGADEKLHDLNELRVPYIETETARWLGTPSEKPLKSLTILDIGCGGGIAL